MSAERIVRLRRLLGVRRHLEQVSEAVCARAAADLAATRAEIRAMGDAVEAASNASLLALHGGDRPAHALALASRALALRHGEPLQLRAQAHEQVLATSRLECARARLQREQCQSVVHRVERAQAAEAARREQAISDDRFAARRHWLAS